MKKLKRKISLIVLIIFICSLTAILANHLQQKMSAQLVQASGNRNTVQKQQSISKNDEKNTSTEVPSSAKVASNHDGDSNLNNVSNSQNNSNANNKSNYVKQADGQNNSVSAATKSNGQENFFIIDNVDKSKNYSSFVNFNGKSVADVTLEVLNRQSIPRSYTSGITGIYFSSINGQKEKSAGEKSGWNYYVNGEKGSVGASSYILKTGDKVEWEFFQNALDN